MVKHITKLGKDPLNVDLRTIRAYLGYSWFTETGGIISPRPTGNGLSIAVPTATRTALTLQTTDDDTTELLLKALASNGTTHLLSLLSDGKLGIATNTPYYLFQTQTRPEGSFVGIDDGSTTTEPALYFHRWSGTPASTTNWAWRQENNGTGLFFAYGGIAETGSHSYSTKFSVLNNGDTTIVGGLTTEGGRIVNVTTVNAATYDLLVTDDILHVTYTGTGAVTSLTLPTAQVVDGRIITIKDAGGNASTYNITIDTEGAETIDGLDTFVMDNDYQAIRIYSDGSDWYVI